MIGAAPRSALNTPPLLGFLALRLPERIPLLLLLIILWTLAGCQTSGPEAEIAAYVKDLAARDSFSGVVLIARDGKPTLEQAYGLANRDYEIPNQADTKFNLGSMNKMFTAIAIMQLIQQGELTLDGLIIAYLPDYPNPEVANLITIQQLLTHTSGLGDIFTPEYVRSPKDDFRTLPDYLPLFADRPLQFEPGTQSAYSNAGFLVLGLIIENVTGQTYFDYVRENIFQPCGMTDTDSYEIDQVVPNIATGYSRLMPNGHGLSSNVYFLPARGSSAGGGYSTAGDLLSFSSCLMNYQILSPEQTENLLAGKVEAPYIAEDAEYGYGFMVQTKNDHRIVGHGGGSPGVCSNLDIFPDLGYTAIILTNSDFDCHPVRTQIREILSK